MARVSVATDNFNRASLGTDWTQWYPAWGSCAINTSVRLAFAGGADNGAYWAGAGSFSDDQYGKIAVSGAVWTNEYIGVGVRMQGSDATRDGYFARLFDNDSTSKTLALIKYVNGTPTTLATTTYATGSTFDLWIEAEGGTGSTVLRVFVGTTQVTALDYTDTSAFVGGTPGAIGNATVLYADDFDGGSLVNAQVDQQTFRFGADDNTESAHTWLETQGTNHTRAVGSAFLLRFLLQATGDAASAAYTLRAQKNGAGGYLPVAVGVAPLADISFIGAGAQAVSTTSGGTVTAAWPAGYTAVAGDVAVLVAAGKHNVGSSSAPSDPSGWGTGITRFREIGTYDLQLTVWVRKLTASEAAPALTVPAAYSGTSGGLSAQVAVYRNVDGTTQQDATAVASDSAAATTWAPTGITTATNKAMVLSIVASADDNALALSAGNEQGFTAPRMSGASYDTTSGGDHAIGLADKVQTTAGAVTCPTWNQTLVASDAWCGITLALRPATLTPEVYIAPSSNIAAGGEATTSRLTGGTGTFLTGRRWDDENGTDTLDLGTDQNTEVEWSINTQSPAVNGDYFDFRVYSGSTALTAYDVTPRLTLGSPAAPTSLPPRPNRSQATQLAVLMSF